MAETRSETTGWSWPRFWRGVANGYVQATFWLLPAWLVLAAYLVWKVLP